MVAEERTELVQVPLVVLRVPGIMSGAVLMYGLMMTFSTALCRPRFRDVAAALGVSERQVRQYAANLRCVGLMDGDNNLLAPEVRPGRSAGRRRAAFSPRRARR
jgi:predicted DNA-binding transcriptional regulator